MPLSLRQLVVLFLLAAVPVHAADLPDPWVEFTSDGGVDVRTITAPGMSCPNVVADATTVPTTTRGQPDPADGAYPLQVCVAHSTTPPRKVTVDGIPVPTLHDHVRQIVVIGDTGCRLKGDIVQDCNDPVKWPFATVARLAAAHHPDLVIHVGDYHYRETPCPADHPGCAGSPYGDNWAVWQRDFFNPAAPLLAAAPWVLVRGNHELCDRGGHGWFRLLDPHPSTVDCTANTEPYTLRIDGLTLLMFDSADANDDKAPPEKVAIYRPQLQALLAEVPPHAWLLTHRPVWALAQGRGIPPGATANATQQAAIKGLVPPTLDMILSGHIHDFASYEFGPARPAQLVVGEGGDLNDVITQPLSAGIPIDGMKPRRAFTTPDYGFILLRHSQHAWSATVYSIADQVLAHCSLHGRDVFCRPRPALMPDPTREAAFDLLSAVLDRRRPLEEALDALPSLAPRDRAAAHRLAAAVLRRMGTLDAVLEPLLRREPPDPVRHVLRIGAAGLLLLNTPSHAAVATAVALARARRLAPFAGLVNAVLRRIAQAGAAAMADLDGPRLDTPAWLWASWGDNARAIALAHQHEAPLDITLRPDAAVPDGGELLPTGSVRFPPGTRVTELDGFEPGLFWVQDSAAALPARLLNAQPGERVADLCAAPGGKTAQLAAAGASVTALERDPHRIARLRENLRRCQLIAETIQADATAWTPSQQFDAVLLDAPCSATGTIRRHPDVPHTKRPRDVRSLTETQDKLLAAATAMLRPGGRLIYAVCSLQPEETVPRIETGLARNNLRHDPFTSDELGALPEALTDRGFLRTLPGLWADRGGMDGFFAARLIKM